MKKFLIGLLIVLGIVAISYVGFGVWTEAKHDKSAYQYIKDEIQEYKDKKAEDNIVEDETTVVINY